MDLENQIKHKKGEVPVLIKEDGNSNYFVGLCLKKDRSKIEKGEHFRLNNVHTTIRGEWKNLNSSYSFCKSSCEKVVIGKSDVLDYIFKNPIPPLEYTL